MPKNAYPAEAGRRPARLHITKNVRAIRGRNATPITSRNACAAVNRLPRRGVLPVNLLLLRRRGQLFARHGADAVVFQRGVGVRGEEAEPGVGAGGEEQLGVDALV